MRWWIAGKLLRSQQRFVLKVIQLFQSRYRSAATFDTLVTHLNGSAEVTLRLEQLQGTRFLIFRKIVIVAQRSDSSTILGKAFPRLCAPRLKVTVRLSLDSQRPEKRKKSATCDVKIRLKVLLNPPLIWNIIAHLLDNPSNAEHDLPVVVTDVPAQD